MRIFQIVRGTKRIADDKEGDNKTGKSVAIQYTFITVGT